MSQIEGRRKFFKVDFKNPEEVKRVFIKALLSALAAILLVLMIYAGLGFSLAGGLGAISAIVGVILGGVFGWLTSLSALIAADKAFGNIGTIVLGGWIFKMIIFTILVDNLIRYFVFEWKILFLGVLIGFFTNLFCQLWAVLSTKVIMKMVSK